MTSTKNAPKKTKVLECLMNGGQLTPPQAKKRFDVNNLRATISDIREELGSKSKNILTGKTKSGVLSYSWKNKK